MNYRPITLRPISLSSITHRLVVLAGACWLGASVLAQTPQLAPLNPAFEAYLAAVHPGAPTPSAAAAPPHGLMPVPVDLSHLRAQAQGQPPGPPRQGYDPRYDLRTLGRVTPVRDQGDYGTCWSFGTYGSLESCLLPAENRNFAENHLVNLAGFDWGFDYGGNAFMSMAYLARWSGPVYETDDPYPNPGGSPAGLPARKHVQQVRLVPPKAGPTYNDEIKQVLMDCGAIDASYYHDDYYYHPTYHSYYCPAASYSNHAVTLVGWDDNYSRYQFVVTPPGNGAYIVKNSWGTGWGESGYFYVSYYDACFANEAMYAFLNAESANNYGRQYSYDQLGWISDIGYGNATCWGANLFTAAASENLSAVAFYANSPNTSYTLEVHTGVAANSPRGGVLACTQSGTCSYPGYRTISLNTPVALTAGQRFAIVLQLTTPGYTYPQPIEKALSGYSSGATASPGQSFISPTGSSWADLTSYYPTANFCIKGFTAAPVSLGLVRNGSNITLTWPSGVLQQADRLQGPFTDVAGATSPYTTAATAQQKFFRLR